jgi:lipopolysaccharide cholinephosphotransferase
MKEVTFEESREIQLDILLYFDDFCKQNGLNYSLGEGTLIGAVRHKGFIPWDDDIDVLMPRKDYDKFLRLYNGKYRLNSLKTEKNWWLCFLRLSDERTIAEWNDPSWNKPHHGLWISVFPIDNYPDESKDWQNTNRKINFWYWMFLKKESKYHYDSTVSLFKNIKRLAWRTLSFCVSYNMIGRKIQMLLTQFNSKPTKNKGLLICVWHEPWVCSADAFADYVELEFEGHKFPAFKGYDAYLRCQYGDYMQLPPVEERVPKHTFKVYWKDSVSC